MDRKKPDGLADFNALRKHVEDFMSKAPCDDEIEQLLDDTIPHTIGEWGVIWTMQHAGEDVSFELFEKYLLTKAAHGMVRFDEDTRERLKKVHWSSPPSPRAGKKPDGFGKPKSDGKNKGGR